jgi:hypothetical protein
MLTLVSDSKSKKALQAALTQNLRGQLKYEGMRNIGHPGGKFDAKIYSAGANKLFGVLSAAAGEGEPRTWNAFGIFYPTKPSQTVVVEINIPTLRNTARVAGFFARDSDGATFLMHSGRIGGGRPGIGKAAFLVWSKAKLFDVDSGRDTRKGIAIGRLGDPALAERVWRFVQLVNGFKVAAVSGELDSPEFAAKIREFNKYSAEFSGKKKVAKGGPFEYLTYHGDVVQRLYDERIERASLGEQVFNSPLIDLFVTRSGVITEVYEVKTGVDRQLLYTAVGQLVTHSHPNRRMAKFLVLPAGEDIPSTFEEVFAANGIKVRRFALAGSPSKPKIVLDQP